jgi:hypothetical protein
MTRPTMNKRDDPETASTSPTLIDPLPLVKVFSHGVEEAVDREKAMQEIEAERDRHPDQGEGEGRRGSRTSMINSRIAKRG